MKRNVFDKTLELSIDNLLAVSQEEFIEYLTDEDVAEIISYECVGDGCGGLVKIKGRYKIHKWLFEDFLADKYDLDWNEYGQLIIDKTKIIKKELK